MEGRKQPLVSVIIPTYNRRRLLLRAVQSALAQTVTDLEVIVADDGSTDGTEALLSSFADQRVRYLQLPHRGACAARNAGIEAACGRYIAFLDSDDTWLPEKLHVQLRQLEDSGADAVCCAFHRHEEKRATRVPEQQEQGPIHYQQLLGGNVVSTQTLFGRAECMKKIRFDESFPRMQDWEYAIRLAKAYKLYFFPQAMADLFVQQDSISRRPELGLKAMRLLLDKYRQEFLISFPNTLLMLSTMEHFASLCGESCIRDYLAAMSPRRRLRDNAVLLRRSAALLLGNIQQQSRRRKNA